MYLQKESMDKKKQQFDTTGWIKEHAEVSLIYVGNISSKRLKLSVSYHCFIFALLLSGHSPAKQWQ